MRVGFVTPSFYPAYNLGGPIDATLRLCEELARAGVEVDVITTDSAGPRVGDRVSLGSCDREYPVGMRVFRYRQEYVREFARAMVSRIWRVARTADLLHLNGVYSMPTWFTLAAHRRWGKPLVWSTHGSLIRWTGTRHPWAKAAWERAAVLLMNRERVVIHAMGQAEAESAVRLGCTNVEICPPGVDVPPEGTDRRWCDGGRCRLGFLGRLDPIKALDRLVAAMALLPVEYELVVAGDGPAEIRTSLEAQVNALGLAGRVRFLGRVASEDRTRFYRSLDMFVLPSHSENFSMVVAEALAAGVPTVVSRGAPWSLVEQRACGRWVENSPASLAEAIREIPFSQLPEMGARAREFAEQELSWQAAARTMAKLYGSLA